MFSELRHLKSEVTLIVVAFFVLLILSSKKRKSDFEWLLLGIVTVIGFLVAIFDIIFEWHWSVKKIFHRTITSDSFGDFLAVLIYLGGLITILSSLSFQRKEERYSEFYFLIPMACVASVAMLRANDLIVLVIAVELLSICLYGLIGMRRGEGEDDKRGIEATLKYFIIGSVATVIMLYGVVLLGGYSGSMQFEKINEKVVGRGYFYVGIVFVFVGLFFKGGVVPFHIWKPDVYEGAGANVTGFMSVCVKIAVVGSITRLLFTAFAGLELFNLLALLSIVTMTIGNFGALRQTNLKRMMAYSSIAHIGYVLVGLCAYDYLMQTNLEKASQALEWILFYVFVYLFMNIGVFLVIMAISMRNTAKEAEYITDYYGLMKKDGLIAVMLMVFMVSLLGLPPSAGFFAKLGIFKSAVDAGFVWLVVIALLDTVVSAYYYLKVVVVMLIDVEEENFDLEREKFLPIGLYFSLWLCFGASVILGILSSGWTDTALHCAKILIGIE